ncbi:hypothetical protein D3C84_1064380 [compost metagenome]
MGLHLQVIEFRPGYRTRAAFTVQHEGMHQPPLRVFFLEHPHSFSQSALYSGIFSGLGEMITPLLSA